MTATPVERARALVGTKFRPQGRDSNGLDCVGLVLGAFGLAPASVRRDYRLRGDHKAEVDRELRRFFRPIARTNILPGDVLLLKPAKDQLHLAIRTQIGMIHADTLIRLVVESPGEPRWPVIGAYRRRVRPVRR